MTNLEFTDFICVEQKTKIAHRSRGGLTLLTGRRLSYGIDRLEKTFDTLMLDNFYCFLINAH